MNRQIDTQTDKQTDNRQGCIGTAMVMQIVTRTERENNKQEIR